jgi:hypothetical protein
MDRARYTWRRRGAHLAAADENMDVPICSPFCCLRKVMRRERPEKRPGRHKRRILHNCASRCLQGIQKLCYNATRRSARLLIMIVTGGWNPSKHTELGQAWVGQPIHPKWSLALGL